MTDDTAGSAPTERRKDGWDVFQILAGVLIPLSIAFVGWTYSAAIKSAEISASADEAGRQEAIARANARVAQAGVVASFLDALLSTDTHRRTLAIRAVLIALPDDGPDLVRVIEQGDNDANVKRYAADSLDERRSALVQQLFQLDASPLKVADGELVSGWRNDPKLVDALLTFARENMTNENGIYDSLVVLNALSLNTLGASREQLLAFTDQVQHIGPKIKAQADGLKAKLAATGESQTR